MKNKLLNYSLIALQVLMIIAVYIWHVWQELSFFDFGILAIYASVPILVAILIYAIRSRSLITITTVVITGILLGTADYVTDKYIATQDQENQNHALLIIDDIYTYHTNNGKWPDSLPQATTLDTRFSLGFTCREFWYTNQDSTFDFRFPAKNGAYWRWYFKEQRMGYYD